MRAPEIIETSRLRLHRPTAGDAPEILARYASDPDVTRFVAWPRHQTIADSEFFVKFSDAEWARWPTGPYLVRSKTDGTLLGSTGLTFESQTVASTGYVFAKDAWGNGYATETVRAMIDLARTLSVQRLYAMCHSDHNASARVLEKTGFTREKILPRYVNFPNFGTPGPADVLCYALDPLQSVSASPADPRG
jgi:ribosomal-protein-alanine N-acetyltransferase